MTAPVIIAVGLVLLVLIFAVMWGIRYGKDAENKAIRNAFENAGVAKDAMDKILASPLELPAGLFDDWVSKGDN